MQFDPLYTSYFPLYGYCDQDGLVLEEASHLSRLPILKWQFWLFTSALTSASILSFPEGELASSYKITLVRKVAHCN